jgi:hypothetical protein
VSGLERDDVLAGQVGEHGGEAVPVDVVEGLLRAGVQRFAAHDVLWHRRPLRQYRQLGPVFLVGWEWKEQPMSLSPEEVPDVIPSKVDSNYDCVRLGSTTHDGQIASPPPGGGDAEEARLCPEGYVPRRRRGPYEARGKRMVSGEPPVRNPDS